MSKYKVGDRVVVISKEKAAKKSYVGPGFVDDMKKYCGKVVTIKDVKSLYYNPTSYYIEEAEWVWCDEFFEGLEENIKRQYSYNELPKIRQSEFNMNAYEAYSKLADLYNFGVTGLNKSTNKKENNTMNKKDILVVRNYNDRAMVVQFNKKDKNGKNIQTRAEVHDGDTFDLDEGIRICLLKYLLGGHKEYMAIMDAARKAYKKTIKEDQKKAAEKHEKAFAPVREATEKMEEKERRDKEIEELIANAIKKALAETGEEENKTVEE